MREGRLLLIDDTGNDFRDASEDDAGDGIGTKLDTFLEVSAILHTVLDILVDTLPL